MDRKLSPTTDRDVAGGDGSVRIFPSLPSAQQKTVVGVRPQRFMSERRRLSLFSVVSIIQPELDEFFSRADQRT